MLVAFSELREVGLLQNSANYFGVDGLLKASPCSGSKAWRYLTKYLGVSVKTLPGF